MALVRKEDAYEGTHLEAYKPNERQPHRASDGRDVKVFGDNMILVKNKGGLPRETFYYCINNRSPAIH